MKNKRLHIIVPEDMYDVLKKYSYEEKMSLGAVVRWLLANQLAQEKTMVKK